MANVSLVTPPLTYVSWSCRRCGHTGGVARTTIPLESKWSESMGRELFTTLRQKLVRVHQKQGCIAIPEDFVIGRYVPKGKALVGII